MHSFFRHCDGFEYPLALAFSRQVSRLGSAESVTERLRKRKAEAAAVNCSAGRNVAGVGVRLDRRVIKEVASDEKGPQPELNYRHKSRVSGDPARMSGTHSSAPSRMAPPAPPSLPNSERDEPTSSEKPGVHTAYWKSMKTGPHSLILSLCVCVCGGAFIFKEEHHYTF